MATRRKPWPGWAEDEYSKILKSAGILVRMCRMAIEESFKGIYDIPLLEHMLPRMLRHSRNIQRLCHEVQRRRRERGGWWPRWAVTALEEGVVLAVEAEGCCESAMKGIKPGNWPLVEQDVRLCLRAARRIEELFQAGPEPEGGPGVLEQAMEVARNAWEDGRRGAYEREQK